MEGEGEEQGFSIQLPPELWDLILSFAPRRDRIIASHVSHAWRALALAKGILIIIVTLIPKSYLSFCFFLQTNEMTIKTTNQKIIINKQKQI